ncbi:MAG: aminopeptidase P family protein [Firmicutes bacterium]|nr:aminopeptidase P family protein [Bacillota bacterium]
MFKNYDCLVLFNPSNRFYFSSFSASSGCVILTRSKKIFITDFRYTEAAKSTLSQEWEVVQHSTQMMTTVMAQIAIISPKAIGFEDDSLPVATFNKLTDELKNILPNTALVPASIDISLKRSIKTDEEISKIAAAQIVAQKAFSKTVDLIKVGMTEREVAAELLYHMQIFGASGAAFDTIVAFGPNSASPHHKTGDKKLQKGDIILIDMGAKVNGYCSDMTRTFCLNDTSSQLKDLHALVLEAQEKALQGIRAGMTTREADAICREFFKANGYEKEFGHSLGHGLGIDLHEFPPVSFAIDEVLQANMVISVEPGLYIDGVGGVRIEDIVVIKENEPPINLTNMSKKIKL